MHTRSVTLSKLGAWVIKCNPAKTDLTSMIATGKAQQQWCVATNYRTELMAAGQPVLFWVSGASRGLWGAGRITGAPIRGAVWKVPTDIDLFADPIDASRLSAVPILASMEVFRSAQQSNPSWVSKREWAAIRTLLPIEMT
ncbi:MAG: hypothetical protein WBD41_14710 [Rhodococcus sp. (in: high G+C Gram-positive bacteria)]|uniref:hypothetical protein n=1 Tax=Rhodococcus sp. EPR-157 TaxID=1813677 RepID=UPI0007BB3D83|nr:hypothetical protein [Rhodococcus sp. EPR-157]KZF03901.1 hypothetical protein A2J03_27790 [Rhodococcus sp. EPR-157]